MPHNIFGKCNQCGACCGAKGSPNQTNPWPTKYLPRHQGVNIKHQLKMMPQLRMCGLRTGPNGVPRLTKEHGATVVSMADGSEKEFYWLWHDGVPCKATPGGQFKSLECPFLLDDPGDGTRPCGLVGSSREDAYRTACHTTEENGGIPPLVFETKEQVDLWHENHPKCKPSEENNWVGFDWIEVG